ncbi:hypothetical protein TNCT_435961 [Trichonephila clavata]|uniref:Uncharacterized protein n=1 Tax=Trichonephila clavata TaxID=2740835 RepID=A0A8X6F2V8_TRICU|nr:hypothetical protein TNCT_435961 [Trichonephila clavata]
MTFQVSLDEVTDVRRNVYFNHRKYEEDQLLKVQNKAMYLNLVLTEKGLDVIPEFSSIEVERHLKCGCICAINKEDRNQKQLSYQLISLLKNYLNKMRSNALWIREGKFWLGHICTQSTKKDSGGWHG